MSNTRPQSRNDFRIAIICALPIESSAVRAVFDEEWESYLYPKLPNDFNSYTFGRIGEHNVILASLPTIGGVPSASSTANIKLSFPAVNLALVVGICGGSPVGEDGKELILGDIVISDGMVQYGYGRRYPDRLRKRQPLQGSSSKPNAEILAFLHTLKTIQNRKGLAERTSHLLEELLGVDDFREWRRPAPETDSLFLSSYRHKHQHLGICDVCDKCQQDRDEVCEAALKASCADLGCNPDQVLTRRRIKEAAETRLTLGSYVHFGVVASADEVMKSALDRDRIAREEHAIAFEMEGAGSWDNIPTIIIKGVCDYADSHKNKDWQQYCSAAAACCMKALLQHWAPTDPGITRDLTWFEARSRLVRPFFGREEVLEDIDRTLCSESGNGLRLVVIHSLGGQGKTQVALEYCERKQQNPFSAMFWIDATSEDSVIASMASVAEDLKVLERIPPPLPDIDSRIKFVRRTLRDWNSHWLMVFDNYDSVDSFSNLTDYFPQGKRGAIIVTSRYASAADLTEETFGLSIELEGLKEQESIGLLLQKSNAGTSSLVYTGLKKVAQRLGNHALALTQAASYMRKNKIGPGEFLTHYNDQRREILDYTSQLSKYRKKLVGAEKEVSLSVFTTWNLSFKQLQNQTGENSIEVQLVTILAFFDWQDIPELLFSASSTVEFPTFLAKELEWLKNFKENDKWNKYHFARASRALYDLALVQSFKRDDEESCHLSLHPLVKDWIRARSDQSTCQKYSLSAAYLLMLAINSLADNWDGTLTFANKQIFLSHVMAQEENHAEYLATMASTLDPEGIKHFVNAQECLGAFLELLDYLNAARKIYKRNLEYSEDALGSEHPKTLETCGSLARVYLELTEYDEAEKFARRAVKGFKDLEVAGSEHQHATLECTYDLGRILDERGKYVDAVHLQEQVLSQRRAILGNNHLDTLRSIGAVSLLHYRTGSYLMAEKMSREALEIVEKTFAESYRTHALTATITNNLALTLGALRKYEESESMHRQTLSIREVMQGQTHRKTLLSMSNLAQSLTDQSKDEEAMEVNQRVLELRTMHLGDDHPDTLTSRNNVATLLFRQGRNQEAEDMYYSTIDMHIQKLGLGHLDTLTMIHNLGSVLSDQGKYEQAEEVYERHLGWEGNDPKTLLALYWRAENLRKWRKFDEAEKLMRKVVAKQRNILGDSHHDVLTAMNQLAIILRAQSKFYEAELMDRDTLAYRRQTLLSTDSAIFKSLNNLGWDLADQGKYCEAVRAMQAAVDGRMKSLGDTHEDTIASLQSLATFHSRLQDSAATESTYRLTLSALESKHGPIHQDTLATLRSLVLVLRKQRKHDEISSLSEEILEKHEQGLGENHINTIQIRSEIGDSLFEAGHVEEAEQHLRRAFSTLVKFKDQTDAVILVTFYRFHKVLNKQRNFTEIERIVQLTIEQRIGSLSPKSKISLMNIGAQALKLQGRYEEAISQFIEVLNLDLPIIETMSDRLWTLRFLAEACFSQKRIDPGAMAALLEWKEKLEDTPDQKACEVIVMVARLFAALGCKESDSMFRKSVSMAAKTYGTNSVQHLNFERELGIHLSNVGKYVESLLVMRRCVSSYSSILADHDLILLDASDHLATAASLAGDEQAAEDISRRITQIAREIHGPTHEKSQVLKNNLGFILCKRGKYKESKLILRAVLHYRSKMLGPTNTEVLRSQYCLAKTLICLEEYDEAQCLAEKAHAGFSKNQSSGPQHRRTLNCERLLARLIHLKDHNHELAESSSKVVVEKLQKTLGKLHPDVLSSTLDIARTQVAQGRFDDAKAVLAEVSHALEATQKYLVLEGTKHSLALEVAELLRKCDEEL